MLTHLGPLIIFFCIRACVQVFLLRSFPSVQSKNHRYSFFNAMDYSTLTFKRMNNLHSYPLNHFFFCFLLGSLQAHPETTSPILQCLNRSLTSTDRAPCIDVPLLHGETTVIGLRQMQKVSLCFSHCHEFWLVIFAVRVP